MLYVQLDTNWPDHPKIIRAGIEGAGLHAIVLCLAKRLEADGWVDRAVLYRQGATDDLIGLLCDLDLLEAEEDRVRPDGWHDRNPSQAAIAATRASKKEAGRRGNHNKWHPGVDFEECAKCQVIAGSDRTVSQEISTPIAPDRTPTSRGIAEVEVPTAIAADLHTLPSGPLAELPPPVEINGYVTVERDYEPPSTFTLPGSGHVEPVVAGDPHIDPGQVVKLRALRSEVFTLPDTPAAGSSTPVAPIATPQVPTQGRDGQ
jgi:hypothetical protein